MSWSIGELSNDVKISKALAKKLFEAQLDEDGNGSLWWNEDEVISEGHLYFNPDHMEHMDWLGIDEYGLVKLLKEAKVKGDITFGSLEGDDAGSFWGYRFDGKGGMKELKGEVSWQVK